MTKSTRLTKREVTALVDALNRAYPEYQDMVDADIDADALWEAVAKLNRRNTNSQKAARKEKMLRIR